MEKKIKAKHDDKPQSIKSAVLALVVLIGVLVALKFSFFDDEKFIKGAKTKQEEIVKDVKVEQAKKNLQITIDKRLDTIKKQINNLEPEDVVKSSPQVQKIIEDLKNLQGVPQTELKNVCQSICETL